MKIDTNLMFADYFSDDFIDYNKDNMGNIIKHISECKNEFILKTRTNGEVLDDVRKKVNNGDYEINNEVEFIDNGIIIPFCFKKFWNLIKDSIPRSIERISIPLHGEKIDIELFSEFNKLEEIELNDYGVFDEKEMNYLEKHTNVKRITCRNIYSLKGKDDTTSTDNIIVYGNILVKDIDRDIELDKLYIETSKLNVNQIKIILDYYKNIKIIYLSENENRFKITINDNNVNIEVSNGNNDSINDLFISLGYNIK